MNLKNKQLTKFATVGVINTAVDVGIFVLLYNTFHLHLILANIVSTGIALMVGYALHSNYTFEKSGKDKRTFAAYLAVTLTGLWILQPLIILVALPVLTANPIYAVGAGLAVLLAKGCSIVASLLWNYAWYSRVIFRPKPQPAGSGA